MHKIYIAILGLSMFFCTSCNEDEGCSNELDLCIEAIELVNRGTFVGGLLYCNAQPGQVTTQAVAQVFLGDTGATILIESDPAGFIDTFFHVTSHCSPNGECLFGDIDFVNENQETIIEFQGGNVSFLRVKNTSYLDCSFTFEGRLPP